MTYQPKQGDIIDLSFNPSLGHEQNGKRPAVVVWNDRMLKRVPGLAMVCPITTTDNGFPLHIKLDGKSTKTKGFIECEQCKVVDLNSRHATKRDRVSDDILLKVLDILTLSITRI